MTGLARNDFIRAAHEYRAARYPTRNGHGLHFIILQIVSLVQLNLFVSTPISRAEP